MSIDIPSASTDHQDALLISWINIHRLATSLFLLLIMTACGEETPSPVISETPEVTESSSTPQRTRDFAQIARGGRLFQQYCASCHGDQAQGDPSWRSRRPDGTFSPPPLDGSAHAWHHPLEALRHKIKHGGPPESSTMPAFGEILTNRQIDDIIAWFQAKWSNRTWLAWYQIDQQAGTSANRR